MKTPWEQAEAACAEGNLPLLQTLVQQHDLISAQRIARHDWTTHRPGRRDIFRHELLMLAAARKGDAGIVRYLVGLSDSFSVRVLVASMDSMDAETMQVLLDANPEVMRAVGTHNVTCLEEAITFGPAKALIAVQVLLRNGYDPNHVHSSIPQAVSYSSPLVVAELERHGALPSKLGFLHLAATSGSMEMVAYLLDAGADIDGNTPYTALYAAVVHQRVDMVCFLRRRGADLSVPVFEGGPTAREVAIQRQHDEIVAALEPDSDSDEQ